MTLFRLIAPTIFAGQLVLGAATSDPAPTTPGGGPVTVALTLPPVLRSQEPADSRHLTLPGPPRSAMPPALIRKSLPPVAKMSKLPTRLVEDPILRQPLPRIAVTALAAPAKPALPSEMGREIAIYCQKQIGQWKEAEARGVLGHPRRQRPAYDEKKATNGTIYAFADPTGRYKDMELDFDRDSGRLRTVFAYPSHLTWQECRRQWDGPTTSADAKQGRTFYSYTNRRLDVLVDATGKVVSLGWY